MTLPFSTMTTFIISFYGVLAVSLFAYKAIDIGITLLKKYNDA